MASLKKLMDKAFVFSNVSSFIDMILNFSPAISVTLCPDIVIFTLSAYKTSGATNFGYIITPRKISVCERQT